MKRLISNSEEDTKLIGKEFAATLNDGAVVVLTGDLGSGKTKFVEGILQYFGLEDEISSPTFTIVNEYVKDDVRIYHFDVYRLQNDEDFFNIGGDEYFGRGICLIEWGEMIEGALPQSYIHVIFGRSQENDSGRIIDIKIEG